MTKIEEVARAIAGPVWDSCSDRMKEQFRHCAREAIRAMLDASPEQIAAINGFSDQYLARYSKTPDAEEIYMTMIDAALAEDKG